MIRHFAKQIFTVCLCFFLVQFAALARSTAGQTDQQPTASTAQFSPEELQQLVAPIALYPDALVAQILAASTYPTQVVEADRWMQDHTGLHGDELAKAVNKQSWDPSIKALTQFPSVLENMDKNLSWTSSLGDAYTNQPQDVTDAVQTLRQQARNAGHLDSNAQENVTTQGDTIVIEPVDPDVVYIPAYDPWLVYGFPILAYPGWYPVPGIFWDGIGSTSVSDLMWASSADSAGGGHTGDTTGTIIGPSTTITPSCRTAWTLARRGSITAISAARASLMITDFVDLPLFTPSQEHDRASSAASTMVAL